MIKFEAFSHKHVNKHKTKADSSIPIAFFALMTISVVNARIANAPSPPSVPFGENISSFCVHNKCTVVFPNGTSVSLSINEFHNFMTEYLEKKGEVQNRLDLEDQTNLKQSVEKNEGAEFLYTKFDFDADKTTSGILHTINPSSGKIIQRTINPHLSNSDSPANEMNAAEHTPDTIQRDASGNSNDREFIKNDLINFNTEQKNERRSRSILSFSIDDVTPNLSSSKNDSESECPAPDPKRIPDGDPSDSASGMDYSTEDSQSKLTKSSMAQGTPSEMDYDYNDKKESQQHLEVNYSQDDIEAAKRMSKCAEIKTTNGMVCVCNETYCDKFVPPERTLQWAYTWYTSSKEGHRFERKVNAFSRYNGSAEGAFFVNTRRQYQEIKGFGATFTDSACKLIQNLNKETKKHLLESYFGPFGINYKLGRVPIGGTDFSPRFYTYLDDIDESLKTFMLTEQDFKYKIPIIMEANEITNNDLKMIGTAWSPPIWMKNDKVTFAGNLERKYFSQWAKYHIKFLDQYLHNGIKFWAITTGRQPVNHFFITKQPASNGLEWTPYEQSYWVGSHLNPMLKNSSHNNVLILGFDENREFLTTYLKFFSEDYRVEYFTNPSYTPKVMDYISGISLQGYMDYKSNLPFLDKAKEMFPDLFFLYTETSCLELDGLPEFGGWTCAEIYAIKIIQALNNWAAGWMDYNLALDHLGGPSYLPKHSLHSPILINLKLNVFYKDPLFYIMGHFSNFLLPGSQRVETIAPEGVEGIYAMAANLPDFSGTVIVFYNQLETSKQVTFIIDEKYRLSAQVPAKSINSIVFGYHY